MYIIVILTWEEMLEQDEANIDQGGAQRVEVQIRENWEESQ